MYEQKPVSQGVVALAFVIFVLSRFLCICRPNEIVVISGRRHRLPDGSSVGYEVLHGGRGFSHSIPRDPHVRRRKFRFGQDPLASIFADFDVASGTHAPLSLRWPSAEGLTSSKAHDFAL